MLQLNKEFNQLVIIALNVAGSTISMTMLKLDASGDDGNGLRVVAKDDDS